MPSKMYSSNPEIAKKTFGLTKEHYITWCNQGLGALAVLAFLIPQTDIVDRDVVLPPDIPSTPAHNQYNLSVEILDRVVL